VTPVASGATAGVVTSAFVVAMTVIASESPVVSEADSGADSEGINITAAVVVSAARAGANDGASTTKGAAVGATVYGGSRLAVFGSAASEPAISPSGVAAASSSSELRAARGGISATDTLEELELKLGQVEQWKICSEGSRKWRCVRNGHSALRATP